MVFNIWFPIAMEIGYKGLRTLYRVMDKLNLEEGYNTKCTTIQRYVNIYAGPLYYMHFKYSSIMNIVFITMMFGTGMPILFPVAACSLMVIYLLEKGMLYYAYKCPPAYDEKLNNSVLSNLSFAPLFLFSFGYWMLTNKQIIQNDNLKEMPTQSSPFMAEHYWY
mmetsp:Transcript_8384/g.14013  ORF Transcript_8384/g.14013 Transcript_8384/m.14013 type:complete len:164 (+) Transcript_8384:2389-2880(+)